MSVSITLTGLKEENQKRFGGRKFECKECGRTSAFEDLQIGIVSSGFDYLCPHCGWWILISTEIMDGKYDESGIERKADLNGVRVFLDGILLNEGEYLSQNQVLNSRTHLNRIKTRKDFGLGFGAFLARYFQIEICI